MKQLYLLRHGETEIGSVSGEDHDRGLTATGKSNARILSQWMEQKNYMPQNICCSSALRTMETLNEIVTELFINHEKVLPPIITERHFYLASAEKLLFEINAADDQIDHLLIVAHNPGIAELALNLAGRDHIDKIYGYVPGTMTVFQTDCDQWADLRDANTQFIDIFTP